jgi:hypothetical protein
MKQVVQQADGTAWFVQTLLEKMCLNCFVNVGEELGGTTTNTQDRLILIQNILIVADVSECEFHDG